MTAKEIVFNYRQLWKIEDSFGELKGSLKSRPIFHWTDQRIIGHLVVCFLAYLCEAHMTKALREQNDKLQSRAIEGKIIKTRPLTATMAMEELNSVLAIPVKKISNDPGENRHPGKCSKSFKSNEHENTFQNLVKINKM